MADQKKQPPSGKDPKNKPQMPLNRGKAILWFYAMLALILIFSMFTNYGSRTKEISWLEFDRKMLSQNDVEKIVVVNQTIANIYIKEDRLSDPKYSDLQGFFLQSKSGPHYSIQLGSLERFENKLEEAQKDFPEAERIQITYTNQINWINYVSWIIPMVLIFFVWMILLGRIGSKGGAGSMFNFTKSTAKLTTFASSPTHR